MILKIIDQRNCYKIVDKKLIATQENILSIFKKRCVFNSSFKQLLRIKIDDIK